MTTGMENPLALQPPTELTVQQTSLVQRGLDLADSAIARLDAFAAAQQTMPVWQQIGIEMVPIPAGPFLMGSNENEDLYAYEDEFPQHVVNLSAFNIARVPVTNEQYEKFVNATGHAAPDHWNQGRIPKGTEKHPVVYVSWFDAQAFGKWAEVRLPTEAEWEKAARGTDGCTFPWGEEETDVHHCNVKTPYCKVPVGSYPKGASPYGVLDTVGYIYEWTNSCFWWYPYRADDGRESSDVDTTRVQRGGPSEGCHDEWDARCASRGGDDPNHKSDLVGFRVVMK